MKSRVVLFAVAVLLLNFISAVAHAQQFVFNGPNPSQWNWPACPGDGTNPANSELFAFGGIVADGSTIYEVDDGLEFDTTPQPALCVLRTSYTTLLPHQVQGIDLHTGSSYGVGMEWVFFVDIVTPVAGPVPQKHYHFRQQYDKHDDVAGNETRFIPVSLSLPTGTVITITRPGVVCLGKPTAGVYHPAYPANYGPYNQNDCATGQSVTLIGK